MPTYVVNELRSNALGIQLLHPSVKTIAESAEIAAINCAHSCFAQPVQVEVFESWPLLENDDGRAGMVYGVKLLFRDNGFIDAGHRGWLLAREV